MKSEVLTPGWRNNLPRKDTDQMRAKEILALLQAEVLAGSAVIDQVEVTRAFAADLMSDVLALVDCRNRDVVLISGVTNPQIIRTAEMLDIPMVVVARGKPVPADTVKLAEKRGIVIIRTTFIVFLVCGLLYEAGIQGARILDKP